MIFNADSSQIPNPKSPELKFSLCLMECEYNEETLPQQKPKKNIYLSIYIWLVHNLHVIYISQRKKATQKYGLHIATAVFFSQIYSIF